MTSLRIRLEARSSVHRCYRAYEIAVGTDLFGAWLVEMSYGRIGTLGRTKARSFSTADEAAAQVTVCLRKRASAPRRIGVAYQVRSVGRGKAWCQPDLDEQIFTWLSSPSDAPTGRGDAHCPLTRIPTARLASSYFCSRPTGRRPTKSTGTEPTLEQSQDQSAFCSEDFSVQFI